MGGPYPRQDLHLSAEAHRFPCGADARLLGGDPCAAVLRSVRDAAGPCPKLTKKNPFFSKFKCMTYTLFPICKKVTLFVLEVFSKSMVKRILYEVGVS
jgi:hypothetical protein